MKSPKVVGIGAFLFAALIFLFVLLMRNKEQKEIAADPGHKNSAGTEQEAGNVGSLLPSAKEGTSGRKTRELEDLSEDYMRGYGEPSTDPRSDLVLFLEVLDGYNSTLKERANLPRGENRELAAALLGDNNDDIRFISPQSPAVDSNGELVDRWGSPLYFHFVDIDLPDIHSAGPDRILWNDDDVIVHVAE